MAEESKSRVRTIHKEEIQQTYEKMQVAMYTGVPTGAATTCIMIATGREDGTIGTVTEKGYVSIGRIDNRPGKLFAHHVAYAAERGQDSLPEDRTMHVSHLCHNKLCVNIDHLIVEPDAYNRSRNYCPYRMRCPCCDSDFFACKHDPPCLAPYPGVPQ